jgi:hypothetical protein
MFLSSAELEDLTSCVTPAAQVMWLKANRVRHVVNGRGELIVSPKALNPKRMKAVEAQFPAPADFKRKAHMLNARPIGIYMLLTGRDPAPASIIYIGKTNNLFSRLADHTRNKSFTHVFFIPTPANLLDVAEREYIARYKPLFNVQFVGTRSAIREFAGSAIFESDESSGTGKPLSD